MRCFLDDRLLLKICDAFRLSGVFDCDLSFGCTFLMCSAGLFAAFKVFLFLTTAILRLFNDLYRMTLFVMVRFFGGVFGGVLAILAVLADCVLED